MDEVSTRLRWRSSAALEGEVAKLALRPGWFESNRLHDTDVLFCVHGSSFPRLRSVCLVRGNSAFYSGRAGAPAVPLRPERRSSFSGEVRQAVKGGEVWKVVRRKVQRKVGDILC